MLFASKMKKPDIAIGGTLAILEIENMEIVNRRVELSFMCFTVPVWLLIVLLNSSVIMKLWKSKQTIINQFMLLDCAVSILYSSLSTFQQSPFYGDMEVYCIFNLGILMTCMMSNRILPVAIVLFR